MKNPINVTSSGHDLCVTVQCNAIMQSRYLYKSRVCHLVRLLMCLLGRFISIQKFINYYVNRKRFLKCQGYCTKGHGHCTKGQSHWQNKNQVKMPKKNFIQPLFLNNITLSVNIKYLVYVCIWIYQNMWNAIEMI